MGDLRIKVIVKPRAKEDRLEKVGEHEYLVSVRQPADRGKANKALLKLLSKHFNGEARIVKGWTVKDKIVEIS
jgi:uncharacterized protein (TIGR00251 family)